MSPIRICLEPGCPKIVTGRGRCVDHRKAVERERSPRRREATGGTFKRKRWLTARERVLFNQPICAICHERIAEEVDHTCAACARRAISSATVPTLPEL